MNWLQHSQKYVAGLRPGSPEHREKIAEASRDWQRMKDGESPAAEPERENPGRGALVTVLVILGVAGLAYAAHQTPPKPVISPGVAWGA